MARVFITGSTDGLGRLAAQHLVSQGHQVVLHARNIGRGEDVLKNVPGAEKVLIGDLSKMNEVKQLAADANVLGRFDAVIHNAGVYSASGEMIWTVNVLAPYILTCLMHRPDRLVYLSSGMHQGGRAKLDRFDAKSVSYSDSKLHINMLTMAVARLWPEVHANAVNPGWVPTKMGGAGAPDDLQKGCETQAWLATSEDPKALVSGKYFFHQQQQKSHKDAADAKLQQQLLAECERQTGVKLPL